MRIAPGSEYARYIEDVLADLGRIVGEVNVANGWDTSREMIANPDSYDPKWVVAHKIAELGLISTEVAEAIEEVRHGRAMRETYYPTVGTLFAEPPIHKPEGVPSELADIVIRVLDIADAYGVDLGAAIIEKLNHNATRGLHHGGKAL